MYVEKNVSAGKRSNFKKRFAAYNNVFVIISGMLVKIIFILSE